MRSLKELIDAKLVKFVFVGVINTVVGTAIMFSFYNLFGFSYWVSTASNYILASILSYFLNKHFTFQDKGKTTKSVLRFVINIVICYLLAYGIAKPAIGFLLSQQSTKVQDNISMLLGMCIFVGLNYIGQRYFVFRNQNS